MISYPDLPLNIKTVYLLEALKVESYWNPLNYTLTLQNKDIPFLNYIESILDGVDISPSKRILLKIRLEDNSKKEDVSIFEGKRKLNFHISKSPFNQEKVKAVTSLPYRRKYNLLVKYKDKKYSLILKAKKNQIQYESKLFCWVYGDLRFARKIIFNFLRKYIPDRKKLRVNEDAFSNRLDLVLAAFGALVDCEGTISWYGFKREIQVRMKSKEYLLDWKRILEHFGIGCRFEKRGDLWGIVVSGWEDFDRLIRGGFRLFHSKKAKKFEEIMINFKRNQISRGSYKLFYSEKLRNVGRRVTSKEFAMIIKKSKRVVNHYLLKLERDKVISCDRTVWPFQYFISK